MMSLLQYLIVALLFTLLSVTAQQDVTPILNTPNGPVYGAKKTYNGQFYEAYLGIPFAAPPVGDLRWEKPQPAQPWTEPLNATHFSLYCQQFIARFYKPLGYGSESGEDCLYINVWVPGGVENNIGRSRPVMIWIYGGAFIFGMGDMYEGYELALHGDMIVVNFNYRVSSLGFLSTGDSELPGNYGLWDQNAAFVWVKENIASFGGDPNRVTIFGQSAGAASVSHAVASPRNINLFNNAIAISGGATSYFALSYQPLQTSIVLGDLFGCVAHNTAELVACLRRQKANALDFYAVVLTMLEQRKIMNIVPTVDGEYLPVHPKQLFQNGAGKDVNFFTGSTYHDSAGFVMLNPVAAPGLGDKINFAKTNESIWAFAKLLIGAVENEDEVFNAVVSMYPDIYSPDLETRTKALTRACTDWWFGSATNWEAQQHSGSGGTGKTYQYRFHYRQSFLLGYADWVTGSHLDDVYSVLGQTFFTIFREKVLKHDFSDTDIRVSDSIMNYYTNIAHTGNPNQGPANVPVQWTEFTPADQNFLEESAEFKMDSFYSDNWVDKFRFWTEDFPALLKFPAPPTFPPGRRVSEFDLARSRVRKYSEQEIEEAIEKVKAELKKVTPDDTTWRQTEQEIQEIIESRNSAVQHQ